MTSRTKSGSRDVPLEEVTHVFFDVEGTLVSSSPGAVEIFRAALAKGGHLLDPSTIARTLWSPDLVVSLIRPMVRGREDDFYRSVNARLIEHLGLAPDEVALDDIHTSFEREIVYRAYPDAVRVLKDLRSAGYETGVVSNFSHRLPRILQDAGLASYLDTMTYSFESGAEKPHPRIYHNALARAGTTAERVLMVGDSYDADYLGARQAGLHAVLLCREGSAPNPCPSIGSLDELTDLLRRPGTAR
jgi:putative hydrolase of the HAD superfamily